jgi:hypothetical protein
MLTLAALLLYCSYVSGARRWYDNYNCPAACANGKEKGGVPLAWMAVNFALVLLTYPERCLWLWPKAGEWWIDKARDWIVDYQGLPKPDRDQGISLWRKGFAWVWYVGSSETVEVAVSGLLWFALGVYWTFDDRNTTHAEWKDYSDIGRRMMWKGLASWCLFYCSRFRSCRSSRRTAVSLSTLLHPGGKGVGTDLRCLKVGADILPLHHGYSANKRNTTREPGVESKREPGLGAESK